MSSRLPLSIACPRCKALPGQPCRGTERGNSHGARHVAARYIGAAGRQRTLRVARDWLRP